MEEAEGIPVRDKRKGKAKLEETDQQSLPQSKPRLGNTMFGDVCYLKLIGQRRVNKTVETDYSAEELQKKIFRVRNIDVPSILGVEDESIWKIHNASRASIGIISDPAARIHHHSYLELLGTPDEVTIAELLIADAITESYSYPFIPTALMPENVCHHRMTIPVGKVMSVLGIDGTNIARLEKQSDTWIELSTFHPSEDDNIGERVVDIYGHELQITKAIKLIMDVISGESVKPEDEWEVDVLIKALAEEGGHQETALLEDEKKKYVEEDGYGEKAAYAQIGIPQLVEEAEDKESGQLGSASQPQVYAKEAK